jgi:hypothetical protein
LDIIVQVGRYEVEHRVVRINVDSSNMINRISFCSDLMITKVSKSLGLGGHTMMYLEVQGPKIFRRVVDEIWDTMRKYLTVRIEY